MLNQGVGNGNIRYAQPIGQRAAHTHAHADPDPDPEPELPAPDPIEALEQRRSSFQEEVRSVRAGLEEAHSRDLAELKARRKRLEAQLDQVEADLAELEATYQEGKARLEALLNPPQ